MTRTRYSNIIPLLIAAGIVLWSPSSYAAAPLSCARVNELDAKITEQIRERASRFFTDRASRIDQLSTRMQGENRRIIAARERQDAAVSAEYARLEVQAQNDAQRNAVVAFRTAVDAAIVARRTAMDAALTEFRDGISSAIEARKGDIEAAIEGFKEGSASAIADARRECSGGGVVSLSWRERLQIKLKLARDRFAAASSAVVKRDADIDALVVARRAALRQASDDFHDAIAKAQKEYLMVSGGR